MEKFGSLESPSFEDSKGFAWLLDFFRGPFYTTYHGHEARTWSRKGETWRQGGEDWRRGLRVEECGRMCQRSFWSLNYFSASQKIPFSTRFWAHITEKGMRSPRALVRLPWKFIGWFAADTWRSCTCDLPSGRFIIGQQNLALQPGVRALPDALPRQLAKSSVTASTVERTVNHL